MKPPVPIRPRGPIDLHWLRATAFTVLLVGLVAAAMGADWPLALAALATSGVGFGFFYLVFPGGSHFGLTMANYLAVYACLFVFFRDANFHDTPVPDSIVALLLPVVGFLAGAFLRRRRVAASIHARRHHHPTHLPSMRRWLPGIALVGAASFALPPLHLNAGTQGATLLVSMAVIALIVAYSARDVVVLLIDIALIFEGVAERVDRLVMPMMAFLTCYSLLVIVFGCLYRIAEISLGMPQFSVHGVPRAISFVEALYFSVITIATVGYGDIVPDGALVRGLASVEVVAGLLLLLFGFSEIMAARAGKNGRDDRG
jgi:voltage-gated potassium channel